MPTTADKLAEAETAYHALMTGSAARVYVDQNGERVEYVVANASRLEQYILRLKEELGTPSVVRPMKVYF